MHYQKLAQQEDQSDRTIETCSQSRGETSIQKIDKMRLILDQFYQEQRRLIEQMKLLSVNIKSGTLRNDETLSRMENSISNLYKGAVQYTNDIGRMMDVTSLPNISSEFMFEQEHSRRTAEKPPKQTAIDIIDDLDEPKLELIKQQLNYIIINLEKLPLKQKSQQYSDLVSAKSAFDNNQLLEASKKLEKILFDKSMEAPLAEACKQIYSDATNRKF